MIDHIEEMMKTAGVESTIIQGRLVNTFNGQVEDVVTHFYPDFTPAKQLEIIKLIAHNTDSNSYPLTIYFDKYNKNYYLFYQIPFDEDKGDTEKNTNNLDFTQALANSQPS